MTTVRESWTDERLNDLSAKVDDLGRRMDAGFLELRNDIRSMHRTTIQSAAVIIAALITLIATQL